MDLPRAGIGITVLGVVMFIALTLAVAVGAAVAIEGSSSDSSAGILVAGAGCSGMQVSAFIAVAGVVIRRIGLKYEEKREALADTADAMADASSPANRTDP